MDKNLLAIDISRLENQALALEQSITKNQAIVQATNFNYYSGQIAVLVGVLGLILLTNLWWIWLFLLVIGALTYFSAKSKRAGAAKQIEDAQANILKLKTEANELRAQLLAHP